MRSFLSKGARLRAAGDKTGPPGEWEDSVGRTFLLFCQLLTQFPEVGVGRKSGQFLRVLERSWVDKKVLDLKRNCSWKNRLLTCPKKG